MRIEKGKLTFCVLLLTRRHFTFKIVVRSAGLPTLETAGVQTHLCVVTLLLSTEPLPKNVNGAVEVNPK